MKLLNHPETFVNITADGKEKENIKISWKRKYCYNFITENILLLFVLFKGRNY